MDKISKIGLVVSIGLMIAWFIYQSDQQKKERALIPAEPLRKEEAITPPMDIPTIEPERPVVEDIEPLKFPESEETIIIQTDRLNVELSAWGGVIKRVVLKENQEAGIRRLPDEESGDVTLIDIKDPMKAFGVLPNFPIDRMAWSRSGNRVSFSYRDEKIRIDKVYEFEDGTYEGKFGLEIENLSGESMPLPQGLAFSAGKMSSVDNGDILGVDILTPTGMVRNKRLLERTNQEIDWAALKTTYFTYIINPIDEMASALEVSGKGTGRNVRQAMAGCASGPAFEELAALLYFNRIASLSPGEKVAINFSTYFGTADYRILQKYGKGYEKVVDFGFWAPISKVIIWSLTELYNLIGSYGWAIIILTVIIKIILWPLTHKSAKSMKEMQKIQPLVSALKEKYKSDPKKIQAETMKLYKEHKINPMGGCLPMVLQIPILFAFFTSLRSAILLRKAPFWIIPGRWIKDLSGPDVFMTLSQPLPILGNQLNILPILMGISFLIQQKYTPTAAATPQAEQQQKMMAILMPVMFIFIFYSLPSGLNLYFLVSNVLSLPQQILAVRRSK